MTSPTPAPGPAVARRRAATAALASLVLFGLLLVLVQSRWGPLRSVDQQVTGGLHRLALAHHGFVLTMKGVSSLGTSVVYVVLVGRLLIWLLRRRELRAAAFAVVATAGGSALNALAKAAVRRPRPVLVDPVAHAGHSSFPSGHAQAVAVGVGVFLVLLLPAVPATRRRLAAGLAVGWAVLMAGSRVALGVHYPSDVVAGLALGAAWVLGCTAVFRPAGLRPDRLASPVDLHGLLGRPADPRARRVTTPRAAHRAAGLGTAVAVLLVPVGGAAAAPAAAPGSTPVAPPATTTAAQVTKVLVVMEENHTLGQMRASMPHLRGLADDYGYASGYHALTYPSLPNYLAIAGGSTFGVRDDAAPAGHPLAGPSVFGQALAHGRTARVYAEGQPVPCDRLAAGR